jgi:hypothetical protein
LYFSAFEKHSAAVAIGVAVAEVGVEFYSCICNKLVGFADNDISFRISQTHYFTSKGCFKATNFFDKAMFYSYNDSKTQV